MEAAIAINWWAVILAAVVKFLIGGVWYAPQVFGKRYEELSGVKLEGSSMTVALVVQFIVVLVMAYILGRFVDHYGATSLINGAVVGFMAWLGFVVTILLGQVFYEKRPLELFYIAAGYRLVGIVVMGAILGAWQ
jgi:Protein of unknown function (DUF1761)